MNEQATPPRRATYQDVIDAPPHMVAEIASGRLHLHPRPAMRHARTRLKLGGRVAGAFDDGVGGPGGWYIVIEPELNLGEDVLVPDLAGWRRERMGPFPDTPATTLALGWACEVLSPGTRRFDMTEERALYAEHGVAFLWLVDPPAQTLEAFELVSGRWTLVAAMSGEDELRAPPFEAVGFPLAALWPD